MATLPAAPAPTPVQTRRPVSTDWLCLYLLASALAGVLLACLLETLLIRGTFQRWELLGQVPDGTAQLAAGEPGLVYIRTTENEILGCRLDNPGECWIPDVVSRYDISEPCAPNHPAFSTASNPPPDIVSCVQNINGTGGHTWNIVYAVDPVRNLWGWRLERDGGDSLIVMMMFLGALGGTMLGSLLWVALLRRYQSAGRALSRGQILLLAVPWLYALFCLAPLFLNRPQRSSNSRPDAQEVSTAAAATIQSEYTQQAAEFLAQVTPQVGPLHYSFSRHACDADWYGDRMDIFCEAGPDSPEAAVRVQSLSTINQVGVPDNAVVLPSAMVQWVRGDYPSIEVQSGDHFRAEITCPEVEPQCNLLFEVSIFRADLSGQRLGEWSLREVTRPKEIDIDLAMFAGQVLHFRLSVSSDEYDSPPNQDLILIGPRIERVD